MLVAAVVVIGVLGIRGGQAEPGKVLSFLWVAGREHVEGAGT